LGWLENVPLVKEFRDAGIAHPGAAEVTAAYPDGTIVFLSR
jgi:hypothetical protein